MAPSEAVPRMLEVSSACWARAIMAGSSAKAWIVRARAQVAMYIDSSIVVAEYRGYGSVSVIEVQNEFSTS